MFEKIHELAQGSARSVPRSNFRNEARVMARLMHPAIVAVFDFGETEGGALYFMMEYVDGTVIAAMIAAQGRLPAEHAHAIVAHVCDALAAAHELGIVQSGFQAWRPWAP